MVEPRRRTQELICLDEADAWYRDRLSPSWHRRTVDQAHGLLLSLGLDSDFWRFS
jgi:hypothetical protein